MRRWRIYHSFSTRVSQFKIWHCRVIGIEINVCRWTLNRYSVITQFVKLAAGEHLCRHCPQGKVQHFKIFKLFSWKITNFEFWHCCVLTLLCSHTVEFWHCWVLTLSSDTVVFWHCCVLTLLSSDTVVFWHCCVLTLLSSDTVVFSHCYVLTLMSSDSVEFWHCCVLTLLCSDSVEFWHCWVLTLLSSDTVEFWHCCVLTLLCSDTVVFWQCCRKWAIWKRQKATDDDITRHTRFACSIIRATDTHSECVILLPMARQ